MKLKLDENLGERGRLALLQAGHEVETVGSQGLCAAADATLQDVCQVEGRALITLDLYFANPLRFPPAESPGFAVIRLPNRASIAALNQAIHVLIQALVQETLTGKLWIVELDRIRIYQPKS